MKHASTPFLVEPDPAKNTTHLITDWLAEDPTSVAFKRQLNGSTEWSEVTISQFHDEVVALAKGLVAHGISFGDRVGLMSRTRYEWTLLDVAIWFAGAVTVPVYETSSPDQLAWILGDSDAVALFVETPELDSRAQASGEIESPESPLDTVWTIEGGKDLAALVELGKDIPDEEIRSRCAQLRGDSPATIIYTSGTTGRPKGCVLTHANFYVLSVNTVARLDYVVAAPGSSTLLFLPLAHVFARFIETLALAARTPLGHISDVKQVVDGLATFQPTFVLSVPRVFEKIYNSAEQKAQSAGRGRIFHLASKTAIAYSRAQDTGGAPVRLRLQHAVFDKLVYGKLRDVFGGKLEYAVSGGGPLGERLGHFFRGIGLIVLEGYGLTESTAPTSVNVPEKVIIGTVGPQLPGNSAAIAEDGEILLKGPHIFSEYWKNEEATREAFTDDDWFRTGDIGELTDEGYLRITGRKKEILVTSGGKNVVPTVLEDRLRAHPLISQCIVVGDGQPYVAALVTLDEEMLPTWLSNHGLPELSVEDAAKHDGVREAVQAAVDRANRAVSRAESIRKFEILTDDFTVDSGHLTPSMKLKRGDVMRDYAEEVESLFR